MTIAETLAEVRQELIPKRDDMLGFELLLAHAIGARREDLIKDSKEEVVPVVLEEFWTLAKRFCDGEPVAYLLGRKEFYGLKFYVDENVLIPRPETEILVDQVVDYVFEQDIEDGCRIVDIGTGCGNIAISIAKRLPNAKITAADVSEKALAVAKENADEHRVNIDFVQSDLLENVVGPFDVIVANLPYIGLERFRFVSKDSYDHEPHVALFGGEMGLELYAKMFDQLKTVPWRPRFICGEFGFLQGDEMRELLNKNFIQHDWDILKDYASIERVFTVNFRGYDRKT